MNPWAMWLALPNPIRAALVSAAFTLNTFLGTCLAAFWASKPESFTFTSFMSYLAGNWFVLAVGYFYGAGSASAFRAKQASNATLPSSPPKGP